MFKSVRIVCLLITLSILCACAPSASVAPTAAPAATAPPATEPAPATAEPVASVELQDLVGWWSSSTSFLSDVHIGADGATEWFYNEQRYRQTRPLARLQLTVSPEGVDVIQVGERGLGYRSDAACWKEAAGRYIVEALSPDAVKFTLSDDACADRRTYFAGITFTRAAAVEQMIGTWKATSHADCRLSVGEDLICRVEQGSSSAATPVIEGTLHWDAAFKQFEVQGLPTCPCGPSAVGKYKLSLDADNRLVFELVEDRCDDRRAALVDWGPFARGE